MVESHSHIIKYGCFWLGSHPTDNPKHQYLIVWGWDSTIFLQEITFCCCKKATRRMQCSEFYIVLLSCKCKHCFCSFKLCIWETTMCSQWTLGRFSAGHPNMRSTQVGFKHYLFRLQWYWLQSMCLQDLARDERGKTCKRLWDHQKANVVSDWTMQPFTLTRKTHISCSIKQVIVLQQCKCHHDRSILHIWHLPNRSWETTFYPLPSAPGPGEKGVPGHH